MKTFAGYTIQQLRELHGYTLEDYETEDESSDARGYYEEAAGNALPELLNALEEALDYVEELEAEARVMAEFITRYEHNFSDDKDYLALGLAEEVMGDE